MAHSSKIKSGLEGKAWKQEYEASDHIASMDRKQRGPNAGVCVCARLCVHVVCAWYMCVCMRVVCVCVPKSMDAQRGLTSDSGPLEMELQALFATRCGCWNGRGPLNQ